MAAVDDLDTRSARSAPSSSGWTCRRRTDGRARSRILDLCAEAARGLGFDPTVAFDGPIDSVVPAELGDDVTTVIREALSNVSRHAGARVSSVRVRAAR